MGTYIDSFVVITIVGGFRAFGLRRYRSLFQSGLLEVVSWSLFTSKALLGLLLGHHLLKNALFDQELFLLLLKTAFMGYLLLPLPLLITIVFVKHFIHDGECRSCIDGLLLAHLTHHRWVVHKGR